MRQSSNWIMQFLNPVLWRPRAPDPGQSLYFDLNGELHKVRPKTGIDKWPIRPVTIKPITGLMANQDALANTLAIAKPPSGPGVGTPIPIGTQLIYPQLPKQMG